MGCSIQGLRFKLNLEGLSMPVASAAAGQLPGTGKKLEDIRRFRHTLGARCGGGRAVLNARLAYPLVQGCEHFGQAKPKITQSAKKNE